MKDPTITPQLTGFVMLTDQHLFWPEKNTICASDQVPLPTSAEFVRSFNGQTHEAIDAMAAVVAGARAGLNWMRVEPQGPEEVREVLDSIVNNGKRAAEIVLRLRGLVKEVPKANGATDH